MPYGKYIYVKRGRRKKAELIDSELRRYIDTDGAYNCSRFKRAFDIFAATLGLVALSPILLAVALLVKLTSEGPVIYSQKRVGLKGKVFNFYKFRTMVVNADKLKEKLERMNERQGPTFKMKSDPRVTRVGRFLRKHSIDELPQLFNILKGDMAIVGPRPPIPSEVLEYEPWQFSRLMAKPGLTCYWQILKDRNVSMDDWVGLDLKYMNDWSPALDMKLILRTIPVCIRGQG